jgi:membrane protease YdiL (CAAX protease family)
MDIKSVFFDNTKRVRSGWRVSAFLLSFFTAAIGALIVAMPVLAMLGVEMTGGSPAVYVTQFGISALVALVFGWFWGRLFEDLPFRALGAWFTGGWLRDLLIGLLIGGASILLAAGISFIFGGSTLHLNAAADGSAIARTLLVTLVIFVFGAAFEELLFRGYILQTLFRSDYAIFGFVFTSLLFATIHNANPGANSLSWFNTFLAGIWLALAYAKTRNLWLAFGLHFSWNWIQGSVLGITVSGLETLAPDPLMRTTSTGPDWISGGSYGIEGGIACTAALVVSIAAVAFMPIKPTDEMLGFTQANGQT